MMLRYLLAALLAVVALAVLACNGGGSSPSTTPTPSPVEEPLATPVTAVFSCNGPAETSAPDASAFPLEISDSVGNTVTLEAPPQRVASLSAGHTEILYAIGAGDQMAAVDSTSD